MTEGRTASVERHRREITLSLISHTNVGKTTLARTLLRRDVGEVLDQAHVTLENERFSLVETDEACLSLWDTPGFGDTARLMRRLRRENQPLRWFLQQVWDRLADRPLWSSQQAARNVRDESDVVLYLVNATEDPEDAGYVRHELDLLTWMEKPVILLLNQTGGSEPTALESRWREHVHGWPIVKDVLSLDAFSRCWVQEDLLFRSIETLLPEESRPTMAELRKAWGERNLGIYRRSVDEMARYLAVTAVARRGLDGSRFSKSAKKKAMRELAEELEKQTAALMKSLLRLYELEGESDAELRQGLGDFLDTGDTGLAPAKGAFWSSVLGGAAGGILTDLKTGGLSFGGGTVVGAVLGGLSGYGLLAGYQAVKTRHGRVLRWTSDFLQKLAHQTLLRYLAVAHYGRGRGEYREVASPAWWRQALESELARDAPRWKQAWNAAQRPDTEAEAIRPEVARVLRTTLDRLLLLAYPSGRSLLEAS